MTWQDALEIVVATTKNERYRLLAADDHADREIWRHRMIEKATGVALAVATSSPYPSAAQMARNLWRDIKAFVRSGGKLAPKSLRRARLAVCEPCEKWDAQQRRCMQCGCKGDVKVYSLAAVCPLSKWPTADARQTSRLPNQAGQS